jgi:hypothetical protein
VESFDAKFPLCHCEVQHSVAICVRLHTICVYTLKIRNYPLRHCGPVFRRGNPLLCLFFCATHAPLCQTKGEASPHCHDKRRNHSLNLSCVNEAEASVFLPSPVIASPRSRRGNPFLCLFCATHAVLKQWIATPASRARNDEMGGGTSPFV